MARVRVDKAITLSDIREVGNDFWAEAYGTSAVARSCVPIITNLKIPAAISARRIYPCITN